MVDLFTDRIELGFLFIFVGVDTFGLWMVILRKIRGGMVYNKRWVLFFICFIIRVVYIEVVEDMISFFVINVICCFVVIRGEVREFCFD